MLQPDNNYTAEENIDFLNFEAEYYHYPIDGIVIKWDNCEIYKDAGLTGHHPKGALAFKFYDEEYDSQLIDIEWSMGRTGQLTPVAIYEPIEIDGTECSRASLHNISIMENILGQPYIGQKIKVAKMNEIIPAVTNAQNEKGEWIH